jgi:ribosomal protein S24E
VISDRPHPAFSVPADAEGNPAVARKANIAIEVRHAVKNEPLERSVRRKIASR